MPVRYVMERFREVQVAVAQLDQKIDDKLGDFAVRMARLELRQEQTDKALDQSREQTAKALEQNTVGRRWLVGMWIAGLSLVVAVVAVIVAVQALGKG